MSKNATKHNKGFTIIEVLIVLAIAGLILLIVFLAVPALQRNARNTSYKGDAASLLGAVSEFSNNNNGKVPLAADSASIRSNAKTKDITGLTIETYAGATAPTLTTAVLRTGAKCPATLPAVGTLAVTTAQGASRQTVLLFVVEAGGGSQAQCQESGV